MMNTTIIAKGAMDKAVYLKIENEDVQFIGFVKSNISMTQEMEEVANKILSTLYDVWTQKYDSINWITHNSEFRYASLVKPLLVAWNAEKSKLIDTQKACMSITAICNFPKKKKAFWINTGSDMVYASKGRRVLDRLGTQIKQLKTFKEQSIFTMDRDYFFKIEGSVIKNYNTLYIVSADAVKYFEENLKEGIETTQERLEGFSFGKQNPIIIGQISASNWKGGFPL